MYYRKHVLFLLGSVIFAMSLTTPTANALRSLSFSETNVRSEGNLRISGEGLPRFEEITCEVTLLRTISRVIPKIEGTLIGKLTGVAIDIPRCRHGEGIRTINGVIALREITRLVSSCTGTGIKLCDVSTTNNLWKLVYRTFLGTLPRINGLLYTVKGMQIKFDWIDSFSVNDICAYEGDQPVLTNVNADAITGSSILLEQVRMTARRLRGIFCPDPIRFGGTFTVRGGPRVTLL